MKFEVRIYGLPVAQGRPRAFKLPSGQIRVYDPQKSRDWKRTVQGQALMCKPERLLVGALVGEMDFYLPRPKSAPKRVVYPTTRPDLGNLVKAVEDAIQGVVYQDDSLIVSLRVAKHYATESTPPSVYVRLEELP
mgnify:FL=1